MDDMAYANRLEQVARTYYRANVHTWGALRRSHSASMVALIAAYLVVTLGLRAAGHPDAAWVATATLGVPLLLVTWAPRRP